MFRTKARKSIGAIEQDKNEFAIQFVTDTAMITRLSTYKTWKTRQWLENKDPMVKEQNRDGENRWITPYFS